MIYPIYQRISACAMVILTLAAAAAAVAGTPCWPLELGTRYLTSDFMEHRSGRFHTGIDLKTGSRSGLLQIAPCTVPADTCGEGTGRIIQPGLEPAR